MEHLTRTEVFDGADAALVAQARAGDDSAVDQLVGKYWTMAYRIALRILRSHEDAEEVAQDALCAAITHLSTFREDACFRTWLHRIAINHSLMAFRKRRARPTSSLGRLLVEGQLSCSDGPRTPEELLLANECRELVDEGLSRVPGFYAIALRLAAREGKSTDEIADSLGISTAAVKTRLHRGRAYLRREIVSRFRVKNTRKPVGLHGTVAA
jgi:RNA polymerase sigma-70 factor (ECF subfamily)